MGLESSSARAEQMARQLLLFDRLIDTAEIVERIEAVTAEAVRELAAKLVAGSPPVGGRGGRRPQGRGVRTQLAERMATA